MPFTKRGREVGEEDRQAERDEREVQALHAQRREPDERADDERDERGDRQRREERHVAERDAEPRVLVVHEQRGRVRADAEERAVPDRHLAVVAGEQVEPHRRDADVERLGDEPRVEDGP